MKSELSTDSGPEVPDRARARRGYDAPRRREQAQRTRDAIAAAARELFAERGWAETKVRDIARAAQVSEPTIYTAYGGKVGLAAALLDAGDPTEPLELMVARLRAARGPSEQLAALVAFDRALFEARADIIRLIREAGRTEPELAAAYQRGRGRGEDSWRRVFAGWDRATFADGVDVDRAIDMYAAICNVDVYLTLLNERGWSADQIESWWHHSLVRLLLR